MGRHNGYTKIELEMMMDEMKKVLPALITVTPLFAELTRVNYLELKKQGFDDRQAMYLAVQSTGKQTGLGQ